MFKIGRKCKIIAEAEELNSIGIDGTKKGDIVTISAPFIHDSTIIYITNHIGLRYFIYKRWVKVLP